MFTSSCHLVCLQRSHDDIPLPDGVAVNIGRSPATRIVDPRCSRNQVAFTSRWSEKKVTVRQLGGNPSNVDGTDIGINKDMEVGEDMTVFILKGQYPHKIVFSGKGVEETSSINNNSKELSNKTNGLNSSLTTVEGKYGKGIKTSLKRPSSSDIKPSGNSKRVKQEVLPSEGKKSSKESSHSSMHEGGGKGEDTPGKVKKDQSDSKDKEDSHVKLVASKLEALKKNVGSVKTVKRTLTDQNEQRKSSSNSPTSTATSARKSSSDSSSSSRPSTAKDNTWTQHEHLYIYTSKGVESRKKIAGFDVDGTIILTKSGKTFPTDHNDWRIAYPDIFGKLKQLHKDGFKIVFFTNQMGVARGKVKIEDLKVKLENIVSKLQVPIQVFVATHQGKYRKPVDGMWRKLKHQYNEGISMDCSLCVYVGDAAGRPADWEPKKKKDFSSSDRLFALNIGVDFQTPEEFFLGHKKAPFKMPEFDPRKLSSSAPMIPSGCKVTLNEKELILLVGYPASGKSHFTKHHLKPKGYVIVNRDTLGSWQKCVKVAEESLVNSSVAIDNTNLTIDERKRYLDCAKKANVPCRCFVMTTSLQHCKHNEKFREMTDSSHAKINEIIFNQAKSKFKEPDMSEGFSEIVKVTLVPKFSSSSMAADYKKFMLEK